VSFSATERKIKSIEPIGIHPAANLRGIRSGPPRPPVTLLRSVSPSAPRARLGITILRAYPRGTRRLHASTSCAEKKRRGERKKEGNNDKPLSALAD